MTPTADEPTMGEVIRRLDAIALQLTEVVRELKEDRAHNARTYVPREVYMAQRLADQAVVADLQGDHVAGKSDLRAEIAKGDDALDRRLSDIEDSRKSDLTFRRQVLLGFAIAAVGWLLTIAVFIGTYLTRQP